MVLKDQARRKQFWIGGGGGGGKDLRGLTIFFCQGLISGVASFLVCRARGGGTKCIDNKLHIGRAEVFVIIIFQT